MNTQPDRFPACWRCWRRSRTRGSGAAARYLLVCVLAVAVACVLAGAKNFREIGDQAADLPQEVLRRLGGTPHPLRCKIIAPSEKRIRTLVHAIGADALDDLTGGWLRALADAGRLDHLLTAIAIDGKWRRGVADVPESGRQPALPRRRHPDHPHSPGHRTRPNPNAQLPTAMRPISQMTLPIPWWCLWSVGPGYS